MSGTNEFERVAFDDEIDAHVQALLGALDPARTDPGYWSRMHLWVMNSAGPELARRRRVAAATVSEVVLSWWQTLVPTAAMAAALAAFLLFRQQPKAAPVAYMDVEEMVTEGVQGPVMPSFETADAEGGIVMVNEIR
jgi:hypothetical protein